MTFWELVKGAPPERAVLADDHGRTMTAAELADAAERVAAGLGVGAGDVVSWQVPTTIEAFVLLVALARVGAVQNPIIPILREREVGLIADAVGTDLFVAPKTWRGFDHMAMAEGLGLAVLALELEADPAGGLRLPAGDPSTLPPPPESGRDYRWAYFSSGTTADPKGARHSDESLIASATGVTERLRLADGDVYPIAFPVTHIGGVGMLAASLRAGGVLLLLDSWEPAVTPERVAAYRPTILGSAQPFLRAYLDAQRRQGDEPLYTDLRTCTSGGAPMPPELVRELVETFGIRGVAGSWGLTEFPIATYADIEDAPEVLAETVGRAVRGVSVQVTDGELRLKGPQCFLGYLDPALDADAFDDEGWFRTGDLGSVDADGNVRITGRLKDVIIRNAENISALEIEDVLLRHPDVVDVAVIGLPDERTGERVCAVLVAPPTVTLEALGEHCRDHGLARFKCPEQIVLVDAIPRNPMGKALKQQLKDELGTPPF